MRKTVMMTAVAAALALAISTTAYGAEGREHIAIVGSSTVYPLAEAIVENFRADGYTGEVTVDSIGSGAGFERFCKTGETDISTASRKIKDSEVESCAAINRTPIEFRVGTDAIAIVVSEETGIISVAKNGVLMRHFDRQSLYTRLLDEMLPQEPAADKAKKKTTIMDYLVQSVNKGGEE